MIIQDNKDALVKIRIPNPDLQYVDVLINGKWVSMHGYLVGMEGAMQYKKQFKLHNLVLVTGDVGSGKTTFTEGFSAVNASNVNSKLTLDNFAWTTKNLLEFTDKEDNIDMPVIWDESIQGASGRNMALTNEGNKLKMAIVTKRFKRHTYYFLIDEINEYAWKLIKMCDAWIHIKRIGMTRGYFNVYTNKNNIKWLYFQFKYLNRSWNHPDVNKVYPDCVGKFDDWTDLFISESEYEKMKMKETKQLESEDKIIWTRQKTQAFYYWSLNKYKQKDIGDLVGMSQSTVANWCQEFKNIINQTD